MSAAAKPTNPWPTVPVSVNVSLPQQFNMSRVPNVAANTTASFHARDLPLTPPADREAVPSMSPHNVNPAMNHHGSYYGMLHHAAPHPAPAAATIANNNLIANYSQSPVDKSMTPPQESQDAFNSIGWWPNNNLPVHSAPNTSACNNPAEFAFHHSMLSHNHHATMVNNGQRNLHAEALPPVAPIINSHSTSNPSEFQQRVAAALLKTHANLASRRCRRCRCPNCQVRFFQNSSKVAHSLDVKFSS